MTARIAPWPDYAGNTISPGDVIRRADGETGLVVFAAHMTEPRNQWCVDYGFGPIYRLDTQVGEQRRAVVVDPAERLLASDPGDGKVDRGVEVYGYVKDGVVHITRQELLA